MVSNIYCVNESSSLGLLFNSLINSNNLSGLGFA